MKRSHGLSRIIDGGRKLLIFHYLRMYLRILGACLGTFGFGFYFLYYLLKVPAKLIYVHSTLFLDNIFFRKYRRVKIENPIFVIGHPRSATSFFHEILTSTEEFVVFHNWEFCNPSLITRRILQRCKTLRSLFNFMFDLRFTPHRIRWEIKDHGKGLVAKMEQHKQKSGFVGQEEEFLFVNTLDTQFVSADTPIGFAKRGYPEICFNDEQPHQDRSVRFFKNCLKRQIYYTGKKQIVAKLNFSIFRIKTLLKFFPDAKFIFIIRSPLDTMPSHLSAHRDALERTYGLSNIPGDKLEQYYKNRYQYNLLFYRHFLNIMSSGQIPQNQFLEITYDSIKSDLGGVIRRLKEFTNLQLSPELEDRLEKQAEKQSSYKRSHVNFPLEEFGLTKEQVESDFDFVFQRYEFANGGKQKEPPEVTD